MYEARGAVVYWRDKKEDRLEAVLTVHPVRGCYLTPEEQAQVLAGMFNNLPVKPHSVWVKGET